MRSGGVRLDELGFLLGDLVPHVLDGVPFEAYGSSLAGNLLRLHERGEGARHAVEQAFGFARTRAVGAACRLPLRKFHLVPHVEHFARVGGLDAAEHMRMAAYHLGVHVGAHVIDCELPRIGGNLALENHLQKHVAKLFTQVGDVLFLDRANGLVGFLYHVVRD